MALVCKTNQQAYYEQLNTCGEDLCQRAQTVEYESDLIVSYIMFIVNVVVFI